MTSIYRAFVQNHGYVTGSASDVWEVLTDWAGILKLRRPSSGDSPLATDKVELEGDPKSTPRTRIIYFKSPDIPEVRETLLHQDDELRHLYYNIEGVGPMGLRNYLATTDVDEVSEKLCQVRISARFDVPEGIDPVQAKSIINAAHYQGVISGLNYFFRDNST